MAGRVTLAQICFGCDGNLLHVTFKASIYELARALPNPIISSESRHNRFMMNQRRSSWSSSSLDCPICPGVEEFILHVLRDCPKATKLWIHLVVSRKTSEFFNSNLEDWISANFRGFVWKSELHQMGRYFCYRPWVWRNK